MLSNQTLHCSFISSIWVPFIWRKVVPKKRVTLQLGQRKNSWPLCPSQQCSHVLWLSRLDQVHAAGGAKVFVWRNVGSARRVTLYLHKRVNRRLGVSPFQLSQLFFTFTRCATFFNPLNHKINIWTLICCPYSFPREVVRRSWWNIKQIHFVWSCPQFSWPLCLTKHWYYKEKFDANHS